MQDPKIWNMISNELSEQGTAREKANFDIWINENEANKILFEKLKSVWNEKGISLETATESLTFRSRFTGQKIKNFILNQALGNFVGFMVGLWVTASFSHYVLEKRGIKNLFGLAKREKVAVKEIPEWLQSGIAILIGFITLELINHFFQTRKHIFVWRYLKKIFTNKFNGQ